MHFNMKTKFFDINKTANRTNCLFLPFLLAHFPKQGNNYGRFEAKFFLQRKKKHKKKRDELKSKKIES